MAAIACYSRGLEADPLNAVLAANRAMAHLNMKHYKEAEEDCNLALSVDRDYVKVGGCVQCFVFFVCCVKFLYLCVCVFCFVLVLLFVYVFVSRLLDSFLFFGKSF